MGRAVFFRIGSANAVSAQSSMRRRREHVLAEVVSAVALGKLRHSHAVLASPEPGAVTALLLLSAPDISVPLDQHSPYFSVKLA